MADQRQNEPAYSTLEVTSSVSEPRQQLSAAQPVCMPESSHRLLGQHDLRHTVDNVLPEAVHDSWPVPAQKEYYDQNQAPGHVPPQDPTPAAAQNRFCGLSRKALWMVIILVLLSIGGIVGGVAGGLTSREPRNEPGNSTATEPTSGSATGVLSSSQLATINWTDSASVQRRAVFYQRSGALFYSQYHASNKSWTQFNISAVFEREPPEDALRVKFGTPLATGAVSLEDIEYATTEGHSTVFAACLYFMDDDNHLREVYSNDYDLTSWVQGSLKDASLEAAGDSHLSALADYCPNPQCTSQFILTYQGTDGEIMMASGPSWTSPRQVDMGNTASALAIIPMASNGGRNITDISEMRIFYYSNTAFEFYYWNFKGLVSGPQIFTLLAVINGKTPQIVATPCDLHGGAFAVAMDGAGKFTASFYDYDVGGGWKKNQRVDFINEGGTPTDNTPEVNLTSIAMDHDGSFYGISSGGKSIVVYSWTSEATVRYTLFWKEKIDVG